MEIRSVLSEKNDLYGVFGFGSFFRNIEYNDIDLLLVSMPNALSPLCVYQDARKSLELVSRKINIDIDITFLTYSEHLGKPLLEHNRLVKIWEKLGTLPV